MTGLARCVGDAGGFLARHWARSPFHVAGADPGSFGDLFSLDDVDRLIASAFARTPTFRLVKDGTPLASAHYTKTARIGGQTVTGVADARKVFEAFTDGATIVLQGLQRYWPPLADYCRALELELTHPVQANAYVTPAGAQGLAVHYDTHDVFVLQLAGSKEWSVYEPVFPDPLGSQPWADHKDEPGPPVLSITLKAGDALYVPRGFPHSARAQTGISAHLTVGVLTTTRHDVVTALAGAAADDLVFRESLPPGFADDELGMAKIVEMTVADLRDWLATVNGEAIAAKVVRNFWARRAPVLAGQLNQLLSVDRIGDGTLVRRRLGTVCHLTVSDDVLAVQLGDRELRMPAALEPAVRRLAAQVDAAPVGELADLLDDGSRLVLVRRLVREGLLQGEHG